MKSSTKKLLIATAVLVFSTFGAGLVSAQKARRISNAPPAVNHPGIARSHPFEPAEELAYVGEFSRALLKKVDVADFRFTATRQESPKEAGESGASRNSDGSPYLLKFTGDVSSKGFFSKLFNLHFRERIESIVEPSSFVVQRTSRIDEQGKRQRTSEAVYDSGKVIWIERDSKNPSRPPRTASSSFTGQVHDLLSAIYYLRTQPLEIGKTFAITVSDSGRVFQVPVRVVEKKHMKTVLGRVEALRVDPDLYGPNGLIGGKGEFSIWFTNDARRIPVSAHVKTDYGTFDITLRKITQNPTSRESLATAKNGN
jgi:hypothetical protein